MKDANQRIKFYQKVNRRIEDLSKIKTRMKKDKEKTH